MADARVTNLVHTLRTTTSDQVRRDTLRTLVRTVLPTITPRLLRSSGLVPLLFDITDPATDTLDVGAISIEVAGNSDSASKELQARTHILASRCLDQVLGTLIRDVANHDLLRRKTPRVVTLLLSIGKDLHCSLPVKDDAAAILVSLLVTLVDRTIFQSNVD